jgi:putative oxidoreductase
MGSVSRSGYRYGPRADEPTTVLDSSEAGSAPARAPVRWHVGADLGLLVLRVTLGVIFIGHGAQKVFGVFGGSGIGGLTEFLASNGFGQPSLLAGLIAVIELAGGSMVLLGLGTQLAAAGLLAMMINAVWLKLGGGLLGSRGDGYELEFALAGIAAAVVLIGPGRIAVDRAIPLFRRPLISGVSCLLVGVGAAILVRGTLHG